MKEKEKLKNLENVHFQKALCKTNISGLSVQITFPVDVCLFNNIYIFQRLGEDDLRYSGYLICGFSVGYVFAPWTQSYGKSRSSLLKDLFGVCTVVIATWPHSRAGVQVCVVGLTSLGKGDGFGVQIVQHLLRLLKIEFGSHGV